MYFDVVWSLDLTLKSSVESCVKDVGDVLVVELEDPVDNPGTTIGTWSSAWHCIFQPFLTRCGS